MPLGVQDTGVDLVQIDSMCTLPAGDNNIGNVDIVTIAAGETHLGEVAPGLAKVITATATTLSTTAYAAGDLLGSRLAWASAARTTGGVGIIKSLTVYDLAAQNSEIDLIFSSTGFSATTFTDNAALAVADSDLPNVIGALTVATTDWVALADNSVASINTKEIVFDLPAGTTTLFGAAVIRNAATYTVTADLGFLLGIVQF